MRIRVFVSVFVFAIAIAGCGGGGGGSGGSDNASAPEAESCPYTRCSSFESRNYAIYRPTTTTTPKRLLVLLHGATQQRDSVEAMWSGKLFADNSGYTIAIPQGNGYIWNYVGDTAWMKRFITSINKEDGPFEAIFLAGWSNGATLAQQIACQNDGQIKGVVSYAGPKLTNVACQPSVAPAVSLIHGTADTMIPISGYSAYSIAGAQETFDFWRLQNNCSGAVTTSPSFALEYGRDSSTQTATACRAPVEFTTSNGGQHFPNWDQRVLHAKLIDFFNRATSTTVR